MKKAIITSLFVFGLISVSCYEADVNQPKGSTIAPQQVTVTDVVNQNGQSIIYYNLPDDSNFKYVKAVYAPRDGETSEVKASFFTDSLILDGFASEGDYSVQLYSVSSGEAYSKPVPVSVSPMRPPYQIAADNSHLQSDWGGVRFTATNASDQALVYYVDMKDPESGEWVTMTEMVSSDHDLRVNIRGLEEIPYQFRYYVADHWGNKTDYREFELTPKYEAECDKSLFKGQVLPPGEKKLKMYSNSNFSYLYNGVKNVPSHYKNGFQLQAKVYTFPLDFTLDLGETYYLSRMEIWPSFNDVEDLTKRYAKLYHDLDIKDFELFGAEFLDMENPLFDDDGNMNPNWTFIGHFSNKRLDGSDLSWEDYPITDLEEYNYSHLIPRNFEFPLDGPKVRYLKFRLISNWRDTNDNVGFAEMSLYGKKVY